ncbi:hypothetical protein MNB_SV-6-373 [hydrothermal vent metagenome]|uniref:Uncharacterized protein n=1 Tax=hydrothermal vent metagenome TaxID=652676 RepID=A0A1W1C913_9ZZZZ
MWFGRYVFISIMSKNRYNFKAVRLHLTRQTNLSVKTAIVN